jgi:hypothetical protein
MKKEMTKMRMGQHDLHITIPLELYKKLKARFPEKGIVTSLIRAFLRKQIEDRRRESD